MTIKLTLTVEKAIIERAKVYARNTGRSLSEIVENHLEAITHEGGNEELSPKLKKIVGRVKLPKGFSEDKTRRSHLENKHL